MHRITFIAGMLATSIIVASATAIAGHDHNHGKKHAKMFEKVDSNQDGMISKAESIAHAEKRFADMDANGDGNITKEEAKTHREAKKEQWGKKKHKADSDAEKDDSSAPEAVQ